MSDLRYDSITVECVLPFTGHVKLTLDVEDDVDRELARQVHERLEAKVRAKLAANPPAPLEGVDFG